MRMYFGHKATILARAEWENAVSEWHVVRLELARTEKFPNGSPSRTYLIRLPLNDDGLIDESARAAEPNRATIRRFWPRQADWSGYILKVKDGWAFSCSFGETDGNHVIHLENHPIRSGEYLTLVEANGTRLPFRVASIEAA